MRIRATMVMALMAFTSFSTFTSTADALFIDFEDMTLGELTGSNSGGTATFDVVEKNNSKRGHIRHVSNTASGDESSLSLTFSYIPDGVVSFEMEALAFLGQYTVTRHGLAGVQVSFLNNLNVVLGTAGLFNVTSSSLLGPTDSSIPSTQQSYSATMVEFASSAGLDGSAPIAKMSLSFLARGFFASGGGIYPSVRSGGDVWVDNISVDTNDASAAQRGVQYCPDRECTLVSKDVGAERWSITYRIADGYATGNVFRTDGGAPSFLGCDRTASNDSQATFECFGAGRCVTAPCSPNPYTSIGTVELPLSFFFPPGEPVR
jgi:hypothetical protein